MRRAIIIVLDSVGAGAAANLQAYDDPNANTLGHVVSAENIQLPHMQALGLGNILPLASVPPAEQPLAAWGLMAPQACGKDTTSGHWEIDGLVLTKPLPTYPGGFPMEVINAFSAATGRGVLGNRVASGTKIIDELGQEHMRTGSFIVYTSADSVFQIAAHEQVVPLTELYAACCKARGILRGPHGLGRVIARPFLGHPGSFYRTQNRRDYSLLPPAGGLLSRLRHQHLPVVSIGKIKDIFAGQDISRSIPAHNNQECMAALLTAMHDTDSGLIFANFVDFDMLYGHRNDVPGYARALAEFDAFLPSLQKLVREDDLLIITADHGNDPTTTSSDHDRENVPLLLWGPGIQAVDVGLRPTFADLGATVAAYLGACPPVAGTSFLEMIINKCKNFKW